MIKIDNRKCGFCLKNIKYIEQLIQSELNSDVYICDECIRKFKKELKSVKK